MKKQQKSPWKAVVVALVLGGLGGLVGYYVGSLLKSNFHLQAFGPSGGGEKALFLLLAFFAIWVVIAIHELGHLGAGIAQGFRVALYTAGFLGVRGTSRGIQFFFNRQFNTMGGLAATFPERLESGPALRRKFVRIVAAGPLASLLLCVVALLVWYVLFQNMGDAPSLFARANAFFWLVTGGMSGFIFLATMIPSRAGGFMSDGARLLSLLDKGEKGLYEETTLSVMVLMGAGKLPGEYPVDLLERLKSRSPDSLLGLNGHFMVFLHHLDRGETTQALPYAQTVEANIAAIPEAFQSHYLKDVVFYYAFFAQDTDAAHTCWNSIQKQAERNADSATFRAKAALALLDGDTAAASQLVQKGLDKITDLPFEGQRKFEDKWLRAVAEEVQERQQTTTI